MIDTYYQSLLAKWPYSDRLLWAFVFWSAHDLSWYIFNGMLYLIYHFELFPQYKIQPADKWPDKKLIIKCLWSSMKNNFIITPVVAYYLYPLVQYFGGEIHAPVPSLFTFAWQIALCFVVNDFLFYWAHRLLHYPPLYKKVHKQHHMFTQTIGIAAEYSHPFEGLIAAAIPTLLPFVLLGCHMTVVWTYIFLRNWETIDAHSGYCFPWSVWTLFPWLNGGPKFHDFHHSANIGNFGMLRFWDWAMGTDAKYREFQKRKEKAN
eukprot:Phypoly_transcript_10805.p1 GENE.Phypoly_transcript_10805~~Phypoly_transcript_10805.p1  ORF type:complete len:262 (+),score=12.91 Phypoly_transcript_10805:437-1222(+)